MKQVVAGFIHNFEMYEENNKLSCIDFDRIKGGKPFDTSVDWYKNMIKEINNI